jgi:cell division protease FtsH
MEPAKRTQFHLWCWVAAFVALGLFQHLYAGGARNAQVPYSEFLPRLVAGQISEVAVSDRFIRGSFTEPLDGRSMFITTRVEPDLARELAEHGVVVTGQIESTLLRDLLSWVGPVALFVGVWARCCVTLERGGSRGDSGPRSAWA